MTARVAEADAEAEAAPVPSARGMAGQALRLLLWSSAANGVLYAILAVLARALTPSRFAVVSVLLGSVGLIGLTLAGFQAAAAAVVAADPDGAREQAALRRGWVLGAAVAVLIAATSPLIADLLNCSVGEVVAAGCMAGSLVPWAHLLGVLQGAGRRVGFARAVFVQAAVRMAALALLPFTHDPGLILMTMAGALVASAVVVRVAALRTSRSATATRAPVGRHSAMALPLVVVAAVGMGFPSVGDVVLTRAVWSSGPSELFAGLSLVGRVLVFLPTAVTGVVYPRMLAADGDARHRLALRAGAVAALAVAPLVVVVTAVPGPSLSGLVGADYVAAANALPVYACACALFGVSSVFVYAAIARSDTRFVVGVVVPVLIAQILLPGLCRDGLRMLGLLQVAVAVCLLALGAVRSWWCSRADLRRLLVVP